MPLSRSAVPALRPLCLSLCLLAAGVTSPSTALATDPPGQAAGTAAGKKPAATAKGATAKTAASKSPAKPAAKSSTKAAPKTAGKATAAGAKGSGASAPSGKSAATGKAVAVGAAAAGTALAVPALAAAAAESAGWPADWRPNPANDPVVEARDALRKRDRARLAALRDTARRGGHPLAMWADYFELSNRLGEASPTEVEGFLARWPGTYVEDRARNDWLLELGRRRDWNRFSQELPRFRMNDDREVACYALLVRHQGGEDVTAAARAAWLAQRDLDDGCALLATTLTEARRLGPADAWAKARAAIEVGRPRMARQAVGLVTPAAAPLVTELFDNPQRFLTRHAEQTRALEPRVAAELWALAVLRLAASDPQAAASELSGAPPVNLGADGESWLWHGVAKQAAMKLQPQADDWFARAGANPRARPELSDDTLAWKVRAALRGQPSPARWQRVLQAVDAMSPETRRADPAWTYWKGRAQLALAAAGEPGDAARLHGRATLSTISTHLSFYGKLAAEELGQVQPLPPHPAPLSHAERENAARHPGLGRALGLMALGLRQEGVREWNWSLIGMDDRSLLAAAQRACDARVWDRCINTSERTRELVDLRQRFPMPFQEDVQAAARRAGVEPAYVYGLIRQESRFLTDARSGVGASGLMQVMPTTAKWTAKKLGVPFQPQDITDPEMNLRLGTGYLKLVLDDFEGSQAMAAAAYNAGPGRPRRWRDGPPMEVAAWAENIPFNETRDYVKKVLSNTAYYAALMGNRAMAPIKTRLQGAIGPRASEAATENRELP